MSTYTIWRGICTFIDDPAGVSKDSIRMGLVANDNPAPIRLVVRQSDGFVLEICFSADTETKFEVFGTQGILCSPYKLGPARLLMSATSSPPTPAESDMIARILAADEPAIWDDESHKQDTVAMVEEIIRPFPDVVPATHWITRHQMLRYIRNKNIPLVPPPIMNVLPECVGTGPTRVWYTLVARPAESHSEMVVAYERADGSLSEYTITRQGFGRFSLRRNNICISSREWEGDADELDQILAYQFDIVGRSKICLEDTPYALNYFRDMDTYEMSCARDRLESLFREREDAAGKVVNK